MDLTSRKIAIKVAAQHAGKQAIELMVAVGSLTEKLDQRTTRFDVDAIWVRRNIAAIRRELDDVEALIAGRDPALDVPPAPFIAAE